MFDPMERISGIMSMVQPVTRRGFLKRASVITLSVPAVASLLAACGGDDDDDDVETPAAPAATSTAGTVPTPGAPATATGAAEATPTTGSGAAATATTGAAPEATATTAAEPTATTGGDTPVMGGTFVTQGHQEVASLHPDDAGPGVHYVTVRNINEPLVDIDLEYAFVPVLAESYEAAADGLSYTYVLREGVLFHDGEEFTSADVKYNVDWYKDPANAAVNGTDYANVGEVVIEDDYNVTVNMTAIDAAYLTNNTVMMIVPEHVHSVSGKDNWSTQAIGTGPFMVKEWKAAEQTTLAKFVDYWGANRTSTNSGWISSPKVPCVRCVWRMVRRIPPTGHSRRKTTCASSMTSRMTSLHSARPVSR